MSKGESKRRSSAVSSKASASSGRTNAICYICPAVYKLSHPVSFPRWRSETQALRRIAVSKEHIANTVLPILNLFIRPQTYNKLWNIQRIKYIMRRLM